MFKSSLALAVVSVLAAAGSARATTVYSQNFEALTVGNLVGQGSPAFQAFPATSPTNTAASVVAGLGVGSSKAAQIDTSPMTGTGFYFQYPITTNFAGQLMTFSYAFDLNAPLLTTDPTDRSSFSAGVYNNGGARITGVGFNATGNLTYTDSAGAPATFVLPTAISSAQGFHTVVLTMDFSKTTPTGTITLDGNLLPITPGIAVGTGSTVTDVDIVASPSGYDVGVFDNLLLVSTATPEPTTLAALGGAAAMMLRRRR